MFSAIAAPIARGPVVAQQRGQRPVSPLLAGQELSGVRFGYIECANAGRRRSAGQHPASLAALQALGAEVEQVTEKIDWIE